MMIIDIEKLLPEDTDLSTLNMDTSDASPAPEPPGGSSLLVQPARSPPPRRIPPLPDQNFIATKVISESEATTPEGIANCIAEMLVTFKELLAN